MSKEPAPCNCQQEHEYYIRGAYQIHPSSSAFFMLLSHPSVNLRFIHSRQWSLTASGWRIFNHVAIIINCEAWIFEEAIFAGFWKIIELVTPLSRTRNVVWECETSNVSSAASIRCSEF